MKDKETISTKLIKHFYGIAGPLDEHARQEVNRIGNNAYLMLLGYVSLSTLVACFLAIRQPITAFEFLIASNLFVPIVLINSYVGISVYRLHLVDREVSVQNYGKSIQKSIIRAIGRAVYFGITMFIFMGVVDWLVDGTKLINFFTSGNKVIKYAFIGILYGGLMLIYDIRRTKKYHE